MDLVLEDSETNRIQFLLSRFTMDTDRQLKKKMPVLFDESFPEDTELVR